MLTRVSENVRVVTALLNASAAAAYDDGRHGGRKVIVARAKGSITGAVATTAFATPPLPPPALAQG